MKLRIALALALLTQGVILAHEHEPLPTRGSTVRGDSLTLSASAAKAIGVATAKVELREVSRTIRAVATVELPWTQQAFVTTLVAGRIEQVLAKPGESVSAGQELARISSMELENLQVGMLQASTEASLAGRLLTQQENAGGGVAGKVLLQTRTEKQQQSARFNADWQKLRAIGLTKETLERICATGETVGTISIDSPIKGIVSVADVRAGEIVEPTAHIYHIVDPSRVWIVGRVLEADVGHVKYGLSTRVTFATLPGRDFRAPIDHVELSLNDDRTLSVKALFDNAGGELKPGMFGGMEIQIDAYKAVVCPKEALIRDGLTSYALVQQPPGNFLRKKVVVRSVRGQLAEISDGLFPGDKVVTVGSHELGSLFAGQPVAQRARTAKRASLSQTTVVEGRVEVPTDQKAFASAPIEGRVRRILVEHGQRVEQGDVLAEIESLQFKTLQLELLQAQVNLRQATLNLERIEKLGQSNAIAAKDLWQVQLRHDSCRRSVASLRRKLMIIGLSEEEIGKIEEMSLADEELTAVLPIRAPAAGLVAEFDLIPGQVVAPQHQMFEIHNLTRAWVQAFVFEQDAIRVHKGQTVHVRLVSDPAFRATAKVERFNPELLAGNRAQSIWVEIDNADMQLKEGMAAIVAIDTPKLSKAEN